jgi:hypothetical protein
MAAYKVRVARQVWVYAEIEVEAKSHHDARAAAERAVEQFHKLPADTRGIISWSQDPTDDSGDVRAVEVRSSLTGRLLNAGVD